MLLSNRSLWLKVSKEEIHDELGVKCTTWIIVSNSESSLQTLPNLCLFLESLVSGTSLMVLLRRARWMRPRVKDVLTNGLSDVFAPVYAFDLPALHSLAFHTSMVFCSLRFWFYHPSNTLSYINEFSFSSPSLWPLSKKKSEITTFYSLQRPCVA